MAGHQWKKVHARLPAVGVGRRGKSPLPLLFLGGLYLNDVVALWLSFAVADHVEELEVSVVCFLVP